MVYHSKSSAASCHPGLEVVPGKGIEVMQSGLEVDSVKYIEACSWQSPDSWKSLESTETKGAPPEDSEGCEHGKETGRVCGLRLRTFWIVLVVGTIVIAASVGAAIVGSLLQKRAPPTNVGRPDSATSVSVNVNRSAESTASSAATTSAASNDTVTTATTTITGSGSRPSRTTAPTATAISHSPGPQTGFPSSSQLHLDCPNLNSTHYISKASAAADHDFMIYCNFDYDTATDMSRFNTTSLQDCVDLCSLVDTNDPSMPCRGVVFYSNITQALQDGSTCHLKADVTVITLRTDLPVNSYAGAVLMR